MGYIIMILSYVLFLMYSRKKILIEMNVLQVHSYENDKLLSQLKDREKYNKQELLKDYMLLVALIPCCLQNRQLMMFTVALFLGIILFTLYRYTYNTITKKPLVITDRVKRMLYEIYPSYIVLSIIPLVLTLILSYHATWIVTIVEVLLYTALLKVTKYFIVLSNKINRPIEKKVNDKYLNEAKDILKDMPGLKVIGVTGSYGKTSTKFMIAQILSEKYAVCKTPESYNTPMGIVRTIREILDRDDEVFVCEMGSRHLGDIKELCDIVNPSMGVITAIGDAHLETFKSIENTKEAKFELARALKKDELLFVNIDNENIVQKLGNDVDKNLNNYRAITYSLKDKDADYYATNITYEKRNVKFDIVMDGKKKETINVESKLLGDFNIYNILAAVAVAKEMKLTNEEIIRGIKKINPVPHRLEILKSTNQITVIDDTFNANPSGSSEALNVLNRLEGNKKIIVTPGMTEMGDKEYELNYNFALECAKKASFTIMVGVNQTKPMQDAFKKEKVSNNKYYVAKNLDDASEYLRGILEVGDVVLYENDMPEDM